MSELTRLALEWADRHALQAREAFTLGNFERAETLWLLADGYRDVARSHGWDEDREVVV